MVSPHGLILKVSMLQDGKMLLLDSFSVPESGMGLVAAVFSSLVFLNTFSEDWRMDFIPEACWEFFLLY